MNLWRTKAAVLMRSLIMLAIVLNLTSCGGKAVSQEPFVNLSENPPISTKEFSEVAPPAVIQELRQYLEIYQPQVSILTPQQGEILQDSTATVRFQVKDLPIFKNSQWDMGPHLHVILDNQPYIAVYDINEPLALPDLSPGTHTLRVFASRPWHESFKNDGAYAQTTFHIFTKSDENNPDPQIPLLTYSRPKGNYGAEPILLDFYLTNAPLHLVAKDNPDNSFADWRIRSTINGESFVLDRWQAVYLKGFKPGKNWVKLEFLDNQGNPVINEFNSTVRLITYEPKGKDTLSKIVRGEVSADQVRGIVDPNYTAKTPIAQPTPTPTTTPEILPTPEPEAIPTPSVTPTIENTPETIPEIQEIEEAPQTQPEKPRFGGFFQRKAGKTPKPEFTAEPSPSVTPVLPEVIETPVTEPEVQPEVTPEPQATEAPETQVTQPEKSKFGGFFNRFQNPVSKTSTEPSPSVSPPVPEVIESPAQTTEAQPEVTPEPQATEPPETQVNQPKQSRFGKYFNRRSDNNPTQQTTVEASPSEPATLPEIVIESPAPESQTQLMPEVDSKALPQKIAPHPDEPELERYFNPNQYPNKPSFRALPNSTLQMKKSGSS